LFLLLSKIITKKMTIVSKIYLDSPISISRAETEKIKHTFSKYTSSFRKKDDVTYNEHIHVKVKHTSLVCHEITEIGRSLGFGDNQIAFIEIIAWLHDIGRFEQYDIYRTFADTESENHAEIALRVIESLNVLKNYDEHSREVIYRSILNHNIPKIPSEEPEIIKFYSQILRDADKLDIWRVSIEMNIFHQIKTESLPDQYDIPVALSDAFAHDRIILLDQVQSFYDSILFRISWIYDLNFTYSLQQVIKRKIIEKLVAKLPPSSTLESISGNVHRYINQQLSQLN
jgi:hypothetical protein